MYVDRHFERHCARILEYWPMEMISLQYALQMSAYLPGETTSNVTVEKFGVES